MNHKMLWEQAEDGDGGGWECSKKKTNNESKKYWSVFTGWKKRSGL